MLLGYTRCSQLALNLAVQLLLWAEFKYLKMAELENCKLEARCLTSRGVTPLSKHPCAVSTRQSTKLSDF